MKIRKYIIVAAVAAAVLSLLVWLVLMFVLSSIPKGLYEYSASGNWTDQAYDHFSIYLPESRQFDLNGMMQVKHDIESSYLTDSIDTADSLYSMSRESGIVIENPYNARKSEATATVFYGDYFRFYKYPLLEGAYPSEEVSAVDSILIDELAAWQIFGVGSNVTGLDVLIDNHYYTVCGVLKEQDGVYADVYGDKPRVMLSGKSSKYVKDRVYYTSLDMLLPNPIEKYAENLIKNGSIGQSEVKIVNQDKRFENESLVSARAERKKALYQTNTTELPFAEKATLTVESSAIAVAVVQNAFLYIAIVCAAILFFALLTPTVNFVGRLFNKFKF